MVVPRSVRCSSLQGCLLFPRHFNRCVDPKHCCYYAWSIHRGGVTVSKTIHNSTKIKIRDCTYLVNIDGSTRYILLHCSNRTGQRVRWIYQYLFFQLWAGIWHRARVASQFYNSFHVFDRYTFNGNNCFVLDHVKRFKGRETLLEKFFFFILEKQAKRERQNYLEHFGHNTSVFHLHVARRYCRFFVFFRMEYGGSLWHGPLKLRSQIFILFKRFTKPIRLLCTQRQISSRPKKYHEKL